MTDPRQAKDDQQTPLPLGYAASPEAEPTRSPLVAVLLCLPGVCCWAVIAAGLWHIRIPRIGAGPVFICWMVAVVTALWSIFLYCEGPRPWYVWMNLILNVAGLLFSAYVAFVILKFGHL